MRRRSVRPFVGRGRTGSPPRAGDQARAVSSRWPGASARARCGGGRLPAPRRPPASRRALPIVDPDDRSHHRHSERLARPARPEPSPARQHHAPMGVDQQPGRPRRNSPGKLTTSSPQPARRPASSVCLGSPDHRPASCPPPVCLRHGERRVRRGPTRSFRRPSQARARNPPADGRSPRMREVRQRRSAASLPVRACW